MTIEPAPPYSLFARGLLVDDVPSFKRSRVDWRFILADALRERLRVPRRLVRGGPDRAWLLVDVAVGHALLRTVERVPCGSVAPVLEVLDTAWPGPGDVPAFTDIEYCGPLDIGDGYAWSVFHVAGADDDHRHLAVPEGDRFGAIAYLLDAILVPSTISKPTGEQRDGILREAAARIAR